MSDHATQPPRAGAPFELRPGLETALTPSTPGAPVEARLSPEGACELLAGALRLLGMTAAPGVPERIAALANGLPEALQGLGGAATDAATRDGSSEVTDEHLERAVALLLEKAPAELRRLYEQSIVRARRGIFPEILLACALSPRDASGSFSAADVRDTLTGIVRREVRGLTNQVGALTETGRGAVLSKQGMGREARYRFVDAALEPYILMRGLEAGWTTGHAPRWLPAAGQQEMLRAA